MERTEADSGGRNAGACVDLGACEPLTNRTRIVLVQPSGRSPESVGSVVVVYNDGSEPGRTALLQRPFGAVQQLTPQPAMAMRRDDQPIDRSAPAVQAGDHRPHNHAVLNGDDKSLGVSIYQPSKALEVVCVRRLGVTGDPEVEHGRKVRALSENATSRPSWQSYGFARQVPPIDASGIGEALTLNAG